MSPDVGGVAVTTRRLAALILVLRWLLMVVSRPSTPNLRQTRRATSPFPSSISRASCRIPRTSVIRFPASGSSMVGFSPSMKTPAAPRPPRPRGPRGEDSTATMQGVNRGLAEASWLQRYESRLAAPSADNPDRFERRILLFRCRVRLPRRCRSGVCVARRKRPWCRSTACWRRIGAHRSSLG